MVKCGRRCCICRRFRPTKLQVHHIVEKGQGGNDEEDNLVVICFSCHSDVHTKVPFARRFSHAELKGHRDALIKQVAQGAFSAEDTDDTDEAIRAVIQAMRGALVTSNVQLLPEATEILLGSVNATDGTAGRIIVVTTTGGYTVQVAGRNLLTNPRDMRAKAKYKTALDQLESSELLDRISDSMYEVTYSGYLIADEMAVQGSKTFTE
jgi:hypothetical protein